MELETDHTIRRQSNSRGLMGNVVQMKDKVVEEEIDDQEGYREREDMEEKQEAVKESSVKESSVKESSVKESSVKESSVKESSAAAYCRK
ncbi:uncharacterized [Tachysurus ichikawai]